MWNHFENDDDRTYNRPEGYIDKMELDDDLEVDDSCD
jgi:hypothetical protein